MKVVQVEVKEKKVKLCYVYPRNEKHHIMISILLDKFFNCSVS